MLRRVSVTRLDAAIDASATVLAELRLEDAQLTLERTIVQVDREAAVRWAKWGEASARKAAPEPS